MGVEGLVGLATAGIGAASAHHTQAANAAAQSKLNKKTMQFNHKEAQLARDFTAAQSAIDRQFNSAEAVAARKFAAQETALSRDFNATEAAKTRTFNASEAAKTRTFDAQQALLAREFEERMSSSAHQREVNDLRLAGLNPILSATGGSGASTPSAPVIGGPAASSSPASSSPASVVSASHSGGSGVAASIGALNAYMKKDVVGQFINSALEGLRVNNDLIKAKAEDKKADAALTTAETNKTESLQRIKESVSRVNLNLDEHDMNAIRKIKEEKLVDLVNEQIKSEMLRRLDQHELSKAQAEACLTSAHAYAGLASAQAHLAAIRGQLETERNPSMILELTKKADHYQSQINVNKWIMEDPESIAKRAYWEGNPSAAGVEHFSKVLGNIVHGSFSIGSHVVKKGR